MAVRECEGKHMYAELIALIGLVAKKLLKDEQETPGAMGIGSYIDDSHTMLHPRPSTKFFFVTTGLSL